MQELEKLKQEATALRQQLEELKAARAKRAQLEEQVSLQQLRNSLDSLVRAEDGLKAQQAAVCSHLQACTCFVTRLA